MELVIIHLVMGPVLLIIAALTKHFPPKNINSFYGYRTPRSMRSAAAWREGNAYSANAMMMVALLTIIFQVATYYVMPTDWSLLLSAVFLVVSLGLLVVLTERHLKQKGFQ